jgi:hypothetical protein
MDIGTDSQPNRSLIRSLVLAMLTPGLGRAIAGNIIPATVLFLLLVILLQIGVTPCWLNATLKFAIWSFFPSIDVGYVTKRMTRI